MKNKNKINILDKRTKKIINSKKELRKILLKIITESLEDETKKKSLYKEFNVIYDYSQVTDMSSLFAKDGDLYKNFGLMKSVPFLHTENVTDVSNMFHSCVSLEEVPQMNFKKVNTYTNIFLGCKNLDLNKVKIQNNNKMIKELLFPTISSKTPKENTSSNDTNKTLKIIETPEKTLETKSKKEQIKDKEERELKNRGKIKDKIKSTKTLNISKKDKEKRVIFVDAGIVNNVYHVSLYDTKSEKRVVVNLDGILQKELDHNINLAEKIGVLNAILYVKNNMFNDNIIILTDSLTNLSNQYLLDLTKKHNIKLSWIPREINIADGYIKKYTRKQKNVECKVVDETMKMLYEFYIELISLKS